MIRAGEICTAAGLVLGVMVGTACRQEISCDVHRQVERDAWQTWQRSGQPDDQRPWALSVRMAPKCFPAEKVAEAEAVLQRDEEASDR